MSDNRRFALVATFCTILAFCAVVLAIHNMPEPPDEISQSVPCVEVDMLVINANAVDLYLNNWEHPPERLPAVPGERHVYRFTTLPPDIKLVRLDPSDVPDSRIVIYSLTIKSGDKVLRQFGPAELKTWTLHNLAAAKEENGGLAMNGTTDDPIVWATLATPLRVPENRPPSRYSPLHLLHLAQRHFRILMLTLAFLLMLVAVVRLGAGDTARALLFETALTALALVIALWTGLTTIDLARLGWVPVPIGDDWDRWLTYVRNPNFLDWLFEQHVEHRIVTSKLVLEIDHFVFHARGWFTLVCTYCLQAITALLLWLFSRHVAPQDRRERLMLAAVIIVCLFSGQQWVNFVWPFQVVFPLLYCATTVAVLALWKGIRQDGGSGGFWIAVSITAAVVATYSMANGVLIWPILLLIAFWFRMPRRAMAVLAGGALLFGVPYFYHWHKSVSAVTLPPSERLPHALLFFFANLGSPLAPLALMRPTESARLIAAGIPGCLLAISLLVGFWILWRQRGPSPGDREDNARAVLLLYGLFFVGSSMSMAYGRSEGSLYEAFTSRYLTPIYLLWVCMLLAAWPWLRRWYRPALYAVLCAAMYLSVATYQQGIVNAVRNWRLGIPIGEVALADNVTDAEAWTPLYHTPRIALVAVDYMRDHRLSIFLEEWTHWPGMSVKSRFSIDKDPAACKGEFKAAVTVPSPLRPGWRASGWAWDAKAVRPPRYVILADDAGKVAGVAMTGLAQTDLQHTGSSWIGYVSGSPRPITAYVLEADDRSLCQLGTQPLPH